MGVIQYIEGKAFEDEVRRSWSVIPDSWLLRITDGKKTGPRPADFIAITNKCNFLIEAKKREALTFNRYTVETHQIKSLLDFDKIGENNRGVILFCAKTSTVHKTFAIHIYDYITFFKEGRYSVSINELKEKAVELRKIKVQGQVAWDLTPMLKEFT